jgi:hypothetical protein
LFHHGELNVSAVNGKQVQTMPEVIRGLTLEKGAHADVQQPIKRIEMDSLASLGNGLLCKKTTGFPISFVIA